MSFPKGEGLEKAVTLLKTLIPRRILADLAEPPPAAEEGKLAGPLPSPLSVTLKGLHSMQSAVKASVLYAPPVDSGLLTKFCEKLRSAFQEAGLMMEDNRPLLLHATILNTIYVKDRNAASRGGKGRSREKLTIDARQILDRYDDYLWIENKPVEKIAICRMGAKKQENGDEAYEVEAEIDVA